MTRYVQKKHGLSIASDNTFYYNDVNGVFHDDFTSMVYTRGYKAVTPWGAPRLNTPAQQLMYSPSVISVPKTLPDGTAYDDEQHGFVLSRIVINWCNHNTPGWGHRGHSSRSDLSPLFFRRRKDSLAFVNWIESLLVDLDFSEY